MSGRNFTEFPEGFYKEVLSKNQAEASRFFLDDGPLASAQPALQTPELKTDN